MVIFMGPSISIITPYTLSNVARRVALARFV
jgi:hypothetical protein